MQANSETVPARHHIGSTICLCFSVTIMLVSLTSVLAAAEGPAPLVSETEFFTDIPAVSSATRLTQARSETPAAVTVIDRDMIKASGARQIADLFRLVPGFQVADVNGYKATVTYHGLSDEYSRRMQVLIDGRSIYSPLLGGVFWSEIPVAIEDIERIEVVRGPNAATYGANSFLGVINIITRHPSQDPGTFIKAAVGDHHIRDGLIRQGWATNASDVRLSIGYRADNGFQNVTDSSHVPFANLRGDFRLSTADTLEVQLGASNASEQIGTGTILDPGRITDTTSHFEQLRWHRSLGAGEEFSAQLYHNYRRFTDDYIVPYNLGPPFGLVQIPVSFDATDERYDLELQHILNPFQNWRFVWGVGTRADYVRSVHWFNRSDTLEDRQYRLFGNAEWRATPETIVNAGAMLEKTDMGDTDLSPRLAVNYHLTPDHTLRAAASKALRTPRIVEQKGNETVSYQNILLYQNIVGPGTLKPEVMHSYELGYFGQIPEQHLTWDLRLYRDQLSDVVTETRISSAAPLSSFQAYGFRNEGMVTVDGIDAQLDYSPSRDNRIILTHAQMFDKATDLGSGVTLNQRQRIASVPRYSSSLLLMHKLSAPWYASAAYYRVGNMLWLGNGDFTDLYSRVDLRLAYKLHVGTSPGEAAVVVQNANHNNYTDFRVENGYDQRIFFTLSMSAF
jgi:iron complex outermembrane receptor protein